MASRKAGAKGVNYEQLAKDVYEETKDKFSLIEDDVSLCSYVSSKHGIELTLAQAGRLRGLIQKCEDEAVGSEPIPAVTVIDCTNAGNMSISSVRSYPDTPAGRKAAQDLFVQWVQQALGDGAAPIAGDARSELIDSGYFEVGEGFVMMVSSTT